MFQALPSDIPPAGYLNRFFFQCVNNLCTAVFFGRVKNVAILCFLDFSVLSVFTMKYTTVILGVVNR